ncbi:H-X9-DG-CTERM domain-containing protein [Flagellimonas sp.]
MRSRHPEGANVSFVF